MAPISPNRVATFKKNLSALETVDGSLAGKLSDVSWPDDLQFLPALDGTPTAFSREFGRSGWYAFSSVPQIREKIVCDQFSPGSANVILPGAGQGVGLQRLLARFNLCQSIYIWEPDLLQIAVLLTLYDFSRDIAGRRLIILADPDLTKTLVDYVASHLDIKKKKKMMSWPWITENHMQEISLKVEKAVGEFNGIINKTVETLQKQVTEILTRIPDRKTPIINIKIISPHVHPRIHQLARDFQSAVNKLGYISEVYVFDRPEHSSGIGVLNELIRTPPDLIISIGIGKKSWSVQIPSTIPFISVLTPPGVGLGEKVADIPEPAENEYFVLGSRDDLNFLLNKKISSEKLFLIEIGVNPDNFRPLGKAVDTQIAVFADHPDSDPEKIGISQESHKFLWKQIEELIRQNPLGFSNVRADVFIGKASQRSGIKISDPELLKSFSLCARRYLGPVAVAEVLVEAMIGAGLKLRIYGSGWQETRFAPIAEVLPGDSETLNEAFNSASMVMVLDNESNFRQNIFDALCAGRRVILKKNPEDLLDRFPEITQRVFFLTPGPEWVGQVKEYLKEVPSTNAETRKLFTDKYSLEGHVGNLLKKIIR